MKAHGRFQVEVISPQRDRSEHLYMSRWLAKLLTALARHVYSAGEL